jgi:hypothetical protein
MRLAFRPAPRILNRPSVRLAQGPEPVEGQARSSIPIKSSRRELSDGWSLFGGDHGGGAVAPEHCAHRITRGLSGSWNVNELARAIAHGISSVWPASAASVRDSDRSLTCCEVRDQWCGPGSCRRAVRQCYPGAIARPTAVGGGDGRSHRFPGRDPKARARRFPKAAASQRRKILQKLKHNRYSWRNTMHQLSSPFGAT